MVGQCYFCHGATAIGCRECMPENWTTVLYLRRVGAQFVITRNVTPEFKFVEERRNEEKSQKNIGD